MTRRSTTTSLKISTRTAPAKAKLLFSISCASVLRTKEMASRRGRPSLHERVIFAAALLHVAVGIQRDAARSLILLGLVLLARAHSLVAPVRRGIHIGLHSRCIATIHVGLAAVGQIEVIHCLFIIRTNFERLVQMLESLLDQRPVLRLDIFADLFRQQLD